MRLALSFITIIAIAAPYPQMNAQEVTRQTPPQIPSRSTDNALPSAPLPRRASELDLSTIPRATVIKTGKQGSAVDLTYDTLSKHDDVYMASGNVIVTYGDHTLRADIMTYNEDTNDVTAEGHVRLTGGANAEYMEASHGTYNLESQTGRFYDVSGSVGLHELPHAEENAPPPNPFLFSGRMVVKTGPQNYEVYDGSVTSCELPKPDWQLFSGKFTLDDEEARASKSTFKLLGFPIMYLPYVTHPVDMERRQSGLLIPSPGYTNTKGLVVGSSAYFALGRSSDLTAGIEYFSRRGYSESGTYRYRGRGYDFFNAHVSALQDRGYIDSSTHLYVNQGGQDVTAAFRKQLTEHTRAVGDVEYLSSYVYREAFTENFNQAVSSDITSIGYVTHQTDGFSVDARVDRYQGLKRVPVGTAAGQQVRIFHAPSIGFDAVDHHIGRTPLLWNIESSIAGLKRSQPNFTSSGMIERLDIRPEISLPLSGGGWHMLTSIAGRETFYSRSRQSQGAVPIEQLASINRTAMDINIDLRPPVIERTFPVPPSLRKLLGPEVRHTVEADLTYRNVRGVNNFLNILRFDDNDLLSNTDEFEYGVTQHLYFKPRTSPTAARRIKPGCPVQSTGEAVSAAPESGAEQSQGVIPDVLDPGAESSTDANGIPSASAQASDAPLRSHAHHDDCADSPAPATQQEEWFSWKVAQRHFFDPTFGGAVVQNRRNIFDTTLSLSGIAFLTEQRNISPLISRLRMRTSSHTDVEWDFDLDTGASKFTSSNIFINAHEGQFFGGLSYARLNAPGRFFTEVIDNNAPPGSNASLVGSATSDFSQMRVLLGYGTPTKPGLSLAGNVGLDLKINGLQYGSFQTSYNWNCCGLSFEYRKYELGSVRNEGVERFSFTLINIGSAGNLRRTERLF
ncbi:MAG TPA: LPS assembly protein LptD [Acidobacteriaceae bacterium]|jgi:LPS-assembly protein